VNTQDNKLECEYYNSYEISKYRLDARMQVR